MDPLTSWLITSQNRAGYPAHNTTLFQLQANAVSGLPYWTERTQGKRDLPQLVYLLTKRLTGEHGHQHTVTPAQNPQTLEFPSFDRKPHRSQLRHQQWYYMDSTTASSHSDKLHAVGVHRQCLCGTMFSLCINLCIHEWENVSAFSLSVYFPFPIPFARNLLGHIIYVGTAALYN